MMVRVAVEGIESALDLEDASWTPELVATFLRMCGDEVVRVCEHVGVVNGRGDDDEGGEESAAEEV